MTTQLFMFQIGPVQSFIEQARRTQDLYVGSRILSELAASGVRAAHSLPGFSAVFPVFDGDLLPRSVPHKFVFLADEDPASVARHIRQAVDERWLEGFAGPVANFIRKSVGGGEWEDVFWRQARTWLEFTWVSVPYDYEAHSDSFRATGRAMAQRKFSRGIAQVDEPGIKCTLTGSQQALPLDWKALSRRLGEVVVRPNEQLGAIASIKRFAQAAGGFHEDLTRFPSASAIAANDPNQNDEDSEDRGREVDGYFAILHMDGDQMGASLGKLQSLEQHKHFSRVLADFADNHAERIIADVCRRENGRDGAGVLVYAGGDDVLALLPLSRALRCAQELRKAFEAISAEALPKGKLTMSAGLAIVPQKLPFDIGLEMARAAEETAKDHFRIIDPGTGSKGAVYVVESHGSGRREAGGCWDDIDFVESYMAWFSLQPGERLSGKYGYDLLELMQTLGPASPNKIYTEIAAVLASEARRLIRRRTGERVSTTEARKLDMLADETIAFAQSVSTQQRADASLVPQNGWERAANWVILARFLASDGKREN